MEYCLDNYHRSNQDTCLVHKPSVFEGQWVESGDLLADCASSVGGELALGQNILIGYMPWEGYNFEDAILISERLVYDDLFTSIHIERHEVEVQQTKLGSEEITREIPDVSEESLRHLNNSGIAKLGSCVEEGDILVGKVTPINKKNQSNYQKLLYTILEKTVSPVRDSSLRTPKQVKAKVVGVQVFKETSNPVLNPKSDKKLSTNKLKKNKVLKKNEIKKHSLRIGSNDFLQRSILQVRKKNNLFFNFKKNYYQNNIDTPFAYQPFKSLSLVDEKQPTVKNMHFFSSLKKSKNYFGYPSLDHFEEPALPFPSPSPFATRPFPLATLSPRVAKGMGCYANGKGRVATQMGRSPIPFPICYASLPPRYAFPSRSEGDGLLRKWEGEGCYASPCYAKGSGDATPPSLLPPRYAKGDKGKGRVVTPFLRSNPFASQHKGVASQGVATLPSVCVARDAADLKQSKSISKNNSFKTISSLLFFVERKKRGSFFPLSRRKELLQKESIQKETRFFLLGKRVSTRPLATQTPSLREEGVCVARGLVNKEEKLNLNKERKARSGERKKLLKGVSSVQIYLAEKRRVQVGDKMAGRHGNKGIISQILPPEDMPFLPDGTPLDMVLNPLGVPSRMNVGQIYECLLGLAGKQLGENFKVFPFDEIYGAEASRSFVYSKLYNARLKTGKDWLFNPNTPGKMRLYDGRTGQNFDQAITVGYAYMLRLVHMVNDKMHSRSTGPYSLVTQQPLRGRSKHGGQRLGEMEVWALEGYGAAFTLLEMLTIKSDDMAGRMTLWSNLILNKEISIGTPESFKVLICELQALCLDIRLFSEIPKKEILKNQ